MAKFSSKQDMIRLLTDGLSLLCVDENLQETWKWVPFDELEEHYNTGYYLLNIDKRAYYESKYLSGGK